MPQLDGLRAIAVLMVFAEHWIRADRRLHIPSGGYGVQLFFTLSGFLITGILLNCRKSAHSKWDEVRIFYVRRFLRIFPVFYVTLFVVALINMEGVRETFWWHFFYLSNICFSVLGNWYGYTAHFWSLSVEEQFYLVWPWLVLFAPARTLRSLIWSCIMVAPLFRGALWLFGEPVISLQVLPVASCSALSFGSLLALLKHESNHGGSAFPHRMVRHAAWIGLAGFVGLELLARHGSVAPLKILGDSFLALSLGWVIVRAADGFPSPVSYVIQNRVFMYLGKISYGLYLYHFFLPRALKKFAFWSDIPHLMDPLIRIPVLVFMTVALASVSWYLFENPINRLKRFFPYR